MAKRLLKHILWGIFLIAAFPAALLSGFGRLRPAYSFFANSFALAPGLPGDYLRIAFYKLTLTECALSSRIQFGSFFAHPEASVGPGVYIGSYCVLGKTTIGANTQIASGVQILSGRHQHARDASGQITGSDKGTFTEVTIGRDCWIGAAAIVMADVGEGTTIGAGSVVSKPIPPNSIAVGSPAKVVRAASDV